MEPDKLYDVAISYAGEHRARAEALATALKSRGLIVFYDRAEEGNLYGQNLQDRLWDVYRNQARRSVVLLSESYGNDTWTRLERHAIEDRSLSDDEYVFPVKLDKTNIHGVLSTFKYIEWPPRDENYIADVILAKLDKQLPSERNERKSVTYPVNLVALAYVFVIYLLFVVIGLVPPVPVTIALIVLLVVCIGWLLYQVSKAWASFGTTLVPAPSANTFRWACAVAVLMALGFPLALRWSSHRAAKEATRLASEAARSADAKAEGSLEHLASLVAADIKKRQAIGNYSISLMFWRTHKDQENKIRHVEVIRSDGVRKNCFPAGLGPDNAYYSLIGCAIEERSLVSWRTDLKVGEPASWESNTGALTGVGSIGVDGRPYIALLNGKKCPVPGVLNGATYTAKSLVCLGSPEGEVLQSGVCLSSTAEERLEPQVAKQYLYSALWTIERMPLDFLITDDQLSRCQEAGK